MEVKNLQKLFLEKIFSIFTSGAEMLNNLNKMAIVAIYFLSGVRSFSPQVFSTGATSKVILYFFLK